MPLNVDKLEDYLAKQDSKNKGYQGADKSYKDAFAFKEEFWVNIRKIDNLEFIVERQIDEHGRPVFAACVIYPHFKKAGELIGYSESIKGARRLCRLKYLEIKERRKLEEQNEQN